MKKKRITGWLIAAGIGTAAVVVGLSIYQRLTEKYKSFSDSHREEIVYIDTDDNLDSVLTKLQPLASEQGLSIFKKLADDNHYGQAIKTGRYRIVADSRVIDIYRQLANHRQEPLMLTVPETRTMPRMAALLSRRLMVDSAAIINVLSDTAYIGRMGYTRETLPSLFVPDTYEVYWDMTVDELMQRLQKEHDAFWNSERRQQAETMGLTVEQVTTLASIVDEETANNPEKPMVAGLYLNRLQKGMLLQADPTVKFALQDFSLRRILNKHLEVDNPYNTYKYAGLPPGPIKVASQKGIDAVLHAERHPYVYMCAKEDFSGTHNFAVTLREHTQNARRYQQALNARGIK